MKMLVSPNAFKEAASPAAAAEVISRHLEGIEVEVKPIADGGDGFLETAMINFNLNGININVSSAYDEEPMQIPAGITNDETVLYIESADIFGMKVIPPDRREIMHLSSKGLGEVLLQVQDRGIKKVVIGVGGTAVNDMGLGALSRLGLRLYDKNSKPLKVLPENFIYAEHISKPADLSSSLEFIIDVANPLLGHEGAAQVFAGQKGASEEDIKTLEEGFLNILRVIERDLGLKTPSDLSGAGGGLSAGFQLFYRSSIKFSHDFIKEDLGLGSDTEQYDYVITGEGAFDGQSLMNKGTGVILDLFKDRVKGIFIICGKADKLVFSRLPENVWVIEMTKYFQNKEEQISNFEKGIKFACREILTLIKS